MMARPFKQGFTGTLITNLVIGSLSQKQSPDFSDISGINLTGILRSQRVVRNLFPKSTGETSSFSPQTDGLKATAELKVKMRVGGDRRDE